MPFTPYHFGPSGFVGLLFRRWVDIPVFILANVVIDLEPGIVLLFGLNYPAHGLCHTFLFGTMVAIAWGLVAYRARAIFGLLMRLFALKYQTNLRKMLSSAMLGVWFHILLDSFCWQDVRPFWPVQRNPFLGLATVKSVYLLCTVCFIPAILLYTYVVLSRIKKARR